MDISADELLKKHPKLIHSEGLQVVSHVQREQGEWFLNTLMLKGYDVPFKYKRTKRFKNLNDQRVNISYYPATESLAGMQIEVMQVVRLRRC
jgi:hypothetical protein